MKRNQSNQIKLGFLILVLILLSLLLAACANKDQRTYKIPVKNEKPKVVSLALGTKWKLPIIIPANEGEFDMFAGWLSNQQILYVTNYGQSSKIFAYNLFTGKHEMIFKTENPIVNVQLSPSKKLILIHSAPSSYEGLVTIINTHGKVQSTTSFPSYDLVFEWNPYNESEILVSKFNEDWSYQLYLLHTKNAQITKISLPQPFVKYLTKDDIVFLNWDKNSPDLFAPLIMKGLKSEGEKTLVSEAIQFAVFHDVLMTVSIDQQDESKASYSFFDREMKKIDSFSIPHLTNFSDWLIPFYDFNVQKEEFITLRPLQSGEADSYTEGFQMVSYHLKTGRNEIILEGAENAPISFSPSGDALLFGNRFDKLIDIKAKKTYNLLRE